MIYIGFSIRTHKTIARIMCKQFKHCAPVVITKNKCQIYQFTKRNQITLIKIKVRDIKTLEKYGWKFIKYNCKFNQQNTLNIRAITCVQFTKKFCGMKKMCIQTPDALLTYLMKNQKAP